MLICTPSLQMYHPPWVLSHRVRIPRIKWYLNQAWWVMPVIQALGRLRQEDHEFKASLVYVVRPCLKQNNQPNPPPKNLPKPHSILCECLHTYRQVQGHPRVPSKLSTRSP
jgi:hypothetical protein